MDLYLWKHADNCLFQKIAVIDYAISVIWVRRFQEEGEFEIYLPASKELFSLLSEGYRIITKGNEDSCAMQVESIQLTTDSEEGDHLIVKGHSAENILGQRIITHQTNVSGRADDAVYTLIFSNVVNPEEESRKIPEFSIQYEQVSDTQMQTQLDGENLLEAVKSLCISAKMGFQVAFSSTGFVFRLYQGLDRTLNQNENAPVVFSPEFDNLGSTEYLYDISTYYNLIQESGEGEGVDRKQVTVTESENIRGLYLREKFIQAETISSSTDEGQMDEETYFRILRQRAEENLRKAKETKEFSGEVLNTEMYQFGKDYNLGDKVTIRNQYGIQGTAVVTEITEVEDSEGYRLIPTFSEWKVMN